jgi:hypothetical protein
VQGAHTLHYRREDVRHDPQRERILSAEPVLKCADVSCFRHDVLHTGGSHDADSERNMAPKELQRAREQRAHIKVATSL